MSFIMNISICNKKIGVIILLSIYSTSYSKHPETVYNETKAPHFFARELHLTPQQNKQQADTSPITLLDGIIDETKKQTNQILTLMTGLSAMINDKQIPVIKQKDVLKTFKDMSNLIQSIQKEKFAQITLGTLHFLLKLNQNLMNHLTQTLKNNFRNMRAFDLAPLLKRGINEESINPEDIQKLLQKNQQQLKTLMKTADNAGLRWYNLAYRKLDNYIIEPSIKYEIPKRALIAGAGLASIIYVWWRLGEESFKKACPGFIYNNAFGPHPTTVRTTQGSFTTNEAELKALGKLEYNLEQLTHGFLPFGAFITAYTALSLKSEWGDKSTGFRAWFNKKISIVHNKLKGGSYLKEAQKALEQIDEVSFNDIVGLDHIKSSFKLLVSYLENPESYDRLGLTPPKGILLVGETRTGKSFSVKALFGEINKMLKTQGRKNEFKFIELNASEINQYGIQYLLNLVKKCAPCIVFIDEIDLLDLQRKGKNQMLSELLTCMSGTLDSKDPKNQVILIGATNMPENLDSALRQPGRFGQEHRFEYPSFSDRKAFITRKLEKLSLNLELFDLDTFTQDTEGKSYEALNILINNALLKARIQGSVLTQEHIEQTLDSEIRHVVPADTKVIPDHQKKLLSIHFAGHALALTLLDTHTKLSKVTIQQVMTDIKEEFMGMHLYKKKEDEKQKRFEYGNVFTHHVTDIIGNMHTYEETLALCKFNLAGIAAEKIILGSCSYSCHKEDKTRALALAQSLAFEGLDVARMPKHIQQQRYDQALAIVDTCEKEIITLLQKNKQKLIRIAQELQDKQSLSLQDIEKFINNGSQAQAQN